MFGVGQEIANRFRLTRQLGGSAAEPVWLASRFDGQSAVVLKFRPATALGAVVGDAASSKLQHPGIAAVIEQLQFGTQSVAVYAFAAQGDLGVSRGRACATWLPWVGAVAETLEYLHSEGLVHGDLKAANVLIDDAGRALLTDLTTVKPIGAARNVADPFSPFSASPEQRSGANVQVGDDIYAFGAMLYELLCAEPPGYTADDKLPTAATAATPDVIPVQPAPSRLIALTMQCLAQRAVDRPISMREVCNGLAECEAVATQARSATPILTPPVSAADVIRPQWQRASRVESPDASQLRRQGFRQGVLVAAVVALAVVAIVLFAWPARQPGSVAASAPVGSTNATVATTTAAANSAALDLQALAVAKTEAESQRENLAPRVAALRTADAISWNPAALTAASTALAESDALMAQRDYAQAIKSLQTLASVVTQLEAGRTSALQAALQRGREAMQERNSAAAVSAFAQALKIDAANREAQRGAQRANNLDAVATELARAASLEQAGKFSDAAVAYRHVLTLDAQTSVATAALARLQSRFAADQFGQAMARGFAELNAAHLAAAREAFTSAQKQRPGDPEVARALEQLAAAEVGTQLSAALAEAQNAASREQWLEATRHYQRALALDGTLVDARAALTQATARAQLDRELQLLVVQPERAYSAAVHDAGVATLQRAQAMAAPGPLLTRQIAGVAAVLRQAETPVAVALRSDGQTSVTVYKVGDLGAFAERSLQLKPGRYVVAGSRSGYRDVRRELVVLPDREPTPLIVQCTELL
jgi:eukaryotic-like serine/threonine-protein kinase